MGTAWGGAGGAAVEWRGRGARDPRGAAHAAPAPSRSARTPPARPPRSTRSRTARRPTPNRKSNVIQHINQTIFSILVTSIILIIYFFQSLYYCK